MEWETIMQRPPVHLRDHVFTKVNIEATEIDYVQDGINKKNPFGYNFTFTCDVLEIDPKERFFKVVLNIASQEKEDHIQGYSIDVTVVGIFEVEKKIPEEEIPKMLGILGPGLLLGGAREFIYTITSRGPCEAVYLPTVNFLPPPDEHGTRKRSQKKAAKKKPAPKKKATKK